MKTTQHLDYDALNSLKDVMEGEFGFLIDTFIQDSADRLDKLYTLIGSDDVDAIRRAAHSFKGSCSNLGALHLANLCAALEQKARENNLTSLGEDLADIEAEFLIVKQRMLAYLG
jgi:histidine phosphotransfer protein HptB